MTYRRHPRNIGHILTYNEGLERVDGTYSLYFPAVYEAPGGTHLMVLDVAPGAMRLYLAETNLKSGKRVEVREVEYYE